MLQYIITFKDSFPYKRKFPNSIYDNIYEKTYKTQEVRIYAIKKDSTE